MYGAPAVPKSGQINFIMMGAARTQHLLQNAIHSRRSVPALPSHSSFRFAPESIGLGRNDFSEDLLYPLYKYKVKQNNDMIQ